MVPNLNDQPGLSRQHIRDLAQQHSYVAGRRPGSSARRRHGLKPFLLSVLTLFFG